MMMNMVDKKTLKIIIVILIISSFIGAIGLTYSYFSLEIEGTPKDIVMTTGDLRLKYIDGTELSLTNAVPGDSITKEIEVKNVGTKSTAYNLKLNNLINTIENFELNIIMN